MPGLLCVFGVLVGTEGARGQREGQQRRTAEKDSRERERERERETGGEGGIMVLAKNYTKMFY